MIKVSYFDRGRTNVTKTNISPWLWVKNLPFLLVEVVQMSPGQLLPWQMSLWKLLPFEYCPRNLTLNFGQIRASNSLEYCWHWVCAVVEFECWVVQQSHYSYIRLSCGCGWIKVFEIADMEKVQILPRTSFVGNRHFCKEILLNLDKITLNYCGNHHRYALNLTNIQF